MKVASLTRRLLKQNARINSHLAVQCYSQSRLNLLAKAGSDLGADETILTRISLKNEFHHHLYQESEVNSQSFVFQIAGILDSMESGYNTLSKTSVVKLLESINRDGKITSLISFSFPLY
jgi:hypothetical protein